MARGFWGHNQHPKPKCRLCGRAVKNADFVRLDGIAPAHRACAVDRGASFTEGMTVIRPDAATAAGQYFVADGWTHIGPDQVERTYRFVYDPHKEVLVRLDELRNAGAPVEASQAEYEDIGESVVQNLDMSDVTTLGLAVVDELPEWARTPAPYTAPFRGPAIG